MRIMVDIDGTICELRKGGQSYKDVRVNRGAVEKLMALKDAGHYIILQTSRHMKTCDGDQGKVVARIGKLTLDWLEQHRISYDEIYFGKPNADVYIDDLAHKFSSWDNVAVDNFDENKVNIVIPMAGEGSRFAKAGFTVPKPLIDVRGKPMIQWAMKSFGFLDQVASYRLIFVVLKAQEEQFHLSETLRRLFGSGIEIVAIDRITRGQAETCLAAKDLIDNYNKLFIYNCDTYSVSKIWEMIVAENPDGILSCFESSDSRYSFARLDEYGFVCEVAEKLPISNLATSGMYYFRRGRDFVNAAEEMVVGNQLQKGEFYVAPCFNSLLESGKKVRAVMAEQNWILGTPEELNYFLSHYHNDGGGK